MLKIINSGCNGKMGQVVQAMCAADPEVTIVAGFGTHQTALEYPVFTNPTNFTGDADVVIDFSSPKALDGLLSFCLERKLPVVIATTGFSPEQLAQIEDASRSFPFSAAPTCLWASTSCWNWSKRLPLFWVPVPISRLWKSITTAKWTPPAAPL